MCYDINIPLNITVTVFIIFKVSIIHHLLSDQKKFLTTIITITT